jgi:hypothetical protein
VEGLKSGNEALAARPLTCAANNVIAELHHETLILWVKRDEPQWRSEKIPKFCGVNPAPYPHL